MRRFAGGPHRWVCGPSNWPKPSPRRTTQAVPVSSAGLRDQTTAAASPRQGGSALPAGDRDEGGEGTGEIFKVLGETAIAPEPGEGALDHPPPRQHDKATHTNRPDR